MRGSMLLLLGVGMLVAGSGVEGGLLDSPVPRFRGDIPGRVVYRLGPVYVAPNADTFIRCTNLAARPARVALEVFDEHDRRRGGVARAVVSPNSDVTFATSSHVPSHGAVIVVHGRPMAYGKARVSATTAELSCAATHVVRLADGQMRQEPVALVKRVAARE